MNVSDQTLSNQLSRILDRVIGSEDEINCKRAWTFTSAEYREKYRTRGQIIGSYADGFTTNGSDIDNMVVCTSYKVKDKVRIGEHEKHAIHAIMSSNISGYVFLELKSTIINNKFENNALLGNPRSDSELFSWIIDSINESGLYYKKRLLLSSLLFKSNINQNLRYLGCESHECGPSNTNILHGFGFHLERETDSVLAFECETWPKFADEFITRNRKYSWPCFSMLSLLKQNGCSFVPIGENNSTTKDIEWRVSFVLSEAMLVRSFNHVQFKTYGLMKLIKNDILDAYKQMHLQESIVTSYHIKTLMFWIVENTPAALWVDKNMVLCLHLCLGFLIHYLKCGYLPNYFLPRCNLFKKNTSGDVETVRDVLKRFKKKTMLLLHAIPHVKIGFILDIGESLSSVLKYTFFYELLLRHEQSNVECLQKIINLGYNIRPGNLVNVLIETIDNEYKHCITYRLLITNRCMDLKLHSTTDVCNKSVYAQRRKYKNITLRGAHLDSSSGWLKLATYFYIIEQYHLALKVAMDSVGRIRSGFIYNFCVRDYQQLLNVLHIDGRTLQQQLRHLTAADIILQNNYPLDLDIEFVNFMYSVTLKLRIPPLMYAHFMVFICAGHLHNVLQQLKALQSLEQLKTDKWHGLKSKIPDTYILLNILGICNERLGDVHRATFYYRESIATKIFITGTPFTEAASIRLELLTLKTTK